MSGFIIVSTETGAQIVPGSFPFASIAALEIVKRGLESADVQPAPASPEVRHFIDARENPRETRLADQRREAELRGDAYLMAD